MSSDVFSLQCGGKKNRQLGCIIALVIFLIAPTAYSDESTQESKRPRFNIWEIRVDGNTILEGQEIEKIIYPYVGPQKTIKDVEAARVALEKFYKSKGFPTVLVNIPQQKVKRGIIRLTVVEGVVGRLRVSGSKYHTLSGIKRKVPSLAEGRVFDMGKVKTEIAQLNQLSPDLSLSPMLKPGRRTGSLEVDLQVNDKLPIHGSLELNNRHSSSTEKLRLSGSISYTNLWQKFHSLSLQYQVSPEDTDQVSVLVGTYLLPINNNRDRIAIYAVKSESDVPSLVDSVLGKGHILGLRYVSIFPSVSAFSHSSSLGLDYKDFEDTILIASALDAQPNNALTTPIQYMQLTAQYNASFQFEHSKTKFSVSSTFGLSAFNDAEEFLNKRLVLEQENAKPNYFYTQFSLQQAFSWNGWQVKFGGDMQYTEDLLISNEQFAIGGENTVRGYFESQHIGDRGTSGYIEFWAPNIFGQRAWSKHWFQLRPYTFYDTANTSVVVPSREETPEYSLDSTGVGVDIEVAKRLKGNFVWAKALVNSGEISRGDERLHFNVQYEF